MNNIVFIDTELPRFGFLRMKCSIVVSISFNWKKFTFSNNSYWQFMIIDWLISNCVLLSSSFNWNNQRVVHVCIQLMLIIINWFQFPFVYLKFKTIANGYAWLMHMMMMNMMNHNDSFSLFWNFKIQFFLSSLIG